MMKNRSELREIAMKVLYQTYIYNSTNTPYDVKELVKEQLEVDNDFVNLLINGVIEHEDDIVKLADKYLNNWTLDRLSKVDKAIFSIAIFSNYS